MTSQPNREIIVRNALCGQEVTYQGYKWTIINYSFRTGKVQLSRPNNGYTHKWVPTANIGGLNFMIREAVK